MEKIRIQKFLSDVGVASRRAVEEMVIAGRITVNGSLVTSLPFFVEEDDDIRVDDRPVSRRPSRAVYFLLNKPKGVVCTMRDPRGRPLAVELVPSFAGRVYCVGGLDDEATGLVILTNDGHLTSLLTDPRLGMEMSYVVEVDGRPDENDVNELKRGMFIAGRRRSGMRLRVLAHSPVRSVLEIRTSEGRNEALRMLFARMRDKIRRIKRTAIGPITERGLKIGHFRPLGSGEVERLHAVRPTRRRGREDRR